MTASPHSSPHSPLRSVDELLTVLKSVPEKLRGLFTDIDDTLTHEGVVVPAAYEELVRAKRLGWRVVAVTGRPAGWAEVLAALWPLDAVVAENGAIAVIREGRSLRTVFWDDVTTQQTSERRLEELRRALLSELPWATLAADQRLRRCDVAFDIGEHRQLGSEEVAALTLAAEGHGARVVASSVHLHVSFADCDKAKMAARLASTLWGEDLAVTRGHYVFVGDSPNDQSCFDYFPLSVGVANVRRYLPLLDCPPVFVTSGPGGHGFAELLSRLLDSLRL
jgi:HAD superfamily hydrolase (TIGR01484 family)